MDWKELEAETLIDLLDFVKLNGDQEEKAWSQAAYTNLVMRFRRDLLEKCTIMCGKIGLTETDAEELTNRVFERYYKYPNGFDVKTSRSKNPETAFRLYLFGIARKELCDYVHPDESPYDGTEKVITSLIDPDKAYEPEMLKTLQETEALIDKTFAQLTPNHKIIYLTYLYHEKEGRYLPARLRDELQVAVGGISKNSIRVYKKQAFDLMKKITNG
ncbi:sigma-70 family RNA polymerase sigma factor [Chitinophaga qingshengii]|uniref:Sigma-70 family RNA polymerase sigma factor n=1 Tax=Chitinophaga qingshengii TaxID=1569794 RepID=A0ABR7THZ6_9BACT|nr:sigma-70 family RNA polymerase sigma factor [Chitinophaga qingshengii]MBC9930125.1 sigma-70 family RNA polymerase sigma factor [Chitinophaga qingshengii]